MILEIFAKLDFDLLDAIYFNRGVKNDVGLTDSSERNGYNFILSLLILRLE